ncbi:MAG: SDR family oxidoreductase [Planctomycetota bacterium]
MIVALTGATGFLGRSLCRHLIREGHTVVGWSSRAESAAWADDLMSEMPASVQWRIGRLGRDADVAALVHGCDACIHAGLSRPNASFLDPGPDVHRYWNENVGGSLQLLEACRQEGLRRCIFVSSGAVHDAVIPGMSLDERHPPRPTTLYGAYKSAVESLFHHYGTSGELVTATVRPTVIYGINAPLASSRWYPLVRQVLESETVDVNKGSKSVHVDDVARSIAICLTSNAVESGGIYNCCDRMISEWEIAEIANAVSGRGTRIIGTKKQAKNEIVTERLRSLGMTFGGTSRLEATLSDMIERIRAGRER